MKSRSFIAAMPAKERKEVETIECYKPAKTIELAVSRVYNVSVVCALSNLVHRWLANRQLSTLAHVRQMAAAIASGSNHKILWKNDKKMF